VGGPDEQMAAVAAMQRGRVGNRQLTTAGMNANMIRHRVRRGTLHRLFRTVYAVGHPGKVELGDATAALLAYGEGASLGYRSGVWIWGFIRREPDGVDVLLRPGGTAKSRPGIRVHRSTTITAADIVIHRGLPVVKPALALLQFGDVAEAREVELAVDEALASKAVSRTKLREAVTLHGAGRRGGSLICELAGVRLSSITRSGGEERLRNLILSSGLPIPEMQARLYGFEGDYYWEEAAYVVEFDGFDVHSTRSAWRRDRLKDRVFAANGIRLDRFTWEDITEQPLATIAHISRQIAERTLRRAGVVS
ncbi:MAG TPA: type IV toxin-antitoxin system AbiEi family antitoxin domain-containing protein, partial [Solirubrobacteraceae bacterium]|nr:type IV toxin-antitoxin system AbiEi family antitoxin domain-containing protein [Solirubrobacteraceae bacterium]